MLAFMDQTVQFRNTSVFDRNRRLPSDGGIESAQISYQQGYSTKNLGTFCILLVVFYERAQMPTISTPSTVVTVPDRRSAIDFGLTKRALRFAQLRAEHPWRTVSACAKDAGYSDRSRAAHVRGCELLRDPRVIRAIVHFGSLELMKAQAEAASKLRRFADERSYYLDVDGWMIRDLTILLCLLASHTDHLNKVLSRAGVAC